MCRSIVDTDDGGLRWIWLATWWTPWCSRAAPTGRSLRPTGVQELRRETRRAVPPGWLRRDRASVPGTEADPAPHARWDRGCDRGAPQGARRPRSGCRGPDDPLPPEHPARAGALGLDDLAGAPAAGLRHPRAPQAAAELADPVRSPAPARALAIRGDALATGRRPR